MQDTSDRLKQQAAETVEGLLKALQRADAATYHALLSLEDREVLPEAAIEQNFGALSDAAGDLVDFAIEGVVLNESALHAAVHVSLRFSNAGEKTELYHLVQEDGAWRMHFDLAELMG